MTRCEVASQETKGEWYCTREAGHDGPCAAVPKTHEYVGSRPISHAGFAPLRPRWPNSAKALIGVLAGAVSVLSVIVGSFMSYEHERSVRAANDDWAYDNIHMLRDRVWALEHPSEQWTKNNDPRGKYEKLHPMAEE